MAESRSDSRFFADRNFMVESTPETGSRGCTSTFRASPSHAAGPRQPLRACVRRVCGCSACPNARDRIKMPSWEENKKPRRVLHRSPPCWAMAASCRYVGATSTFCDVWVYLFEPSKCVAVRVRTQRRVPRGERVCCVSVYW